MQNINKDTKAFKLLEALKLGQTISPAQARKRWDIQNIRAEASRLRQAGYTVASHRRLAGNHVEVTEYMLVKQPKTRSRI